jgi:hypothetical protein
LEAYEPPPPPDKEPGEVIEVPHNTWAQVGKDVVINQGIIIPIKKESNSE